MGKASSKPIIRNKAECVRALSEALPDVTVHVLHLIAEFVPYGKFISHFMLIKKCKSSKVTPTFRPSHRMGSELDVGRSVQRSPWTLWFNANHARSPLRIVLQVHLHALLWRNFARINDSVWHAVDLIESGWAL